MSTLELPRPASTIQPDNYRFLQEFVYAGSGIVLEQDKHYLLEARLSMLARTRGLQSINDLCNLLRATRGDDQGVKRAVVEAMTTNETYFFREPAQYEAIKTVLLKDLREMRSGLRAGSASGRRRPRRGRRLIRWRCC